MTADELRACRAIGPLSYPPASWPKRFARTMWDRAQSKPESVLSDKQVDALWRQVVKFRRQITDTGLVLLAKEIIAQREQVKRQAIAVHSDDTVCGLLTGYAEGDLFCLALMADRLEERGSGEEILKWLRGLYQELLPHWSADKTFPSFDCREQYALKWRAWAPLRSEHFWHLRPSWMVVHDWSLYPDSQRRVFKKQLKTIGLSFDISQRMSLCYSLVVEHGTREQMASVRYVRRVLDSRCDVPAPMTEDAQLPLFQEVEA